MKNKFKYNVDHDQHQYGDLNRPDAPTPQKGIAFVKPGQGEGHQKEHQSPHDNLAGHGQQKGVGFQLGYEKAVEKADHRTQNQREKNTRHRPHIQLPGCQYDDAGRKSQRGLHGKIQLSHHHHNSHAQHQQAERCGLIQDIQLVLHAEKRGGKKGVGNKKCRKQNPHQIIQQGQLYLCLKTHCFSPRQYGSPRLALPGISLFQKNPPAKTGR